MRIPESIFDDFAVLLGYPGIELEQALLRTLLYFSDENVQRRFPAANLALQDFASAMGALSTTEREELYTRTFDINPSASLEVGWHLYGEQYERGSFLVLMRQLLRQYDVEEGSELPDHLTHVLRLFARMDEETRTGMLDSSLLRALEVMFEKWSDEENPYKRCLDALASMFHTLRPEREGVPAHV